MDTRETDVPHRVRTLVWRIAVVAVLFVAVGTVAYRYLFAETRAEACTNAGVKGPEAGSPKEAFDRWFDERSRQASEPIGSPSQFPWPSPDRVPERDDFDRVGDHTWKWRFESDALLKVEVRRVRADDGSLGDWHVSAANTCQLIDG